MPSQLLLLYIERCLVGKAQQLFSFAHLAAFVFRSYGVVGYEVYSEGLMPYAGRTNDQVCAMVTSGKRLQQPESCPDAIFRILLRCWSFKPSNRVDFTLLIGQLSNVIQRLRQGATDADLMQSSTIRKLAQRAAKSKKHRLAIAWVAPIDEAEQDDNANPYLFSTRASEHRAATPDDEETSRPSTQAARLSDSASVSSDQSRRSSTMSDDSRLHNLEQYIMVDDIAVTDGVVVLEPGTAANPELAHFQRYGTTRGGTYLGLLDSDDNDDCGYVEVGYDDE